MHFWMKMHKFWFHLNLFSLINNIPVLVQITDWCQPGNKPLSEPIMVSLVIHQILTWWNIFIKIFLLIPSYLNTEIVQTFQLSLITDMDLFTLHIKYHDCWWPYHARTGVISSKGVDINLLEYYGLGTKRVFCRSCMPVGQFSFVYFSHFANYQ